MSRDQYEKPSGINSAGAGAGINIIDKTPPQVLSSQWLSHSRWFHVEELQLQFSNGWTLD